MEEETEIKVQNLTKFYTLALLKSSKSVTGYKILKRLESDLGKTASPTYIYDFLKKLKSEGYVEDVELGKSKRSQGFRLTKSGEIFVDRIFLRLDNLIEVAIQSKLKICVGCGAKLYENYYTQKFGEKNLNFCCKHCAMAYIETIK